MAYDDISNMILESIILYQDYSYKNDSTTLFSEKNDFYAYFDDMPPNLPKQLLSNVVAISNYSLYDKGSFKLYKNGFKQRLKKRNILVSVGYSLNGNVFKVVLMPRSYVFKYKRVKLGCVSTHFVCYFKYDSCVGKWILMETLSTGI